MRMLRSVKAAQTAIQEVKLVRRSLFAAIHSCWIAAQELALISEYNNTAEFARESDLLRCLQWRINHLRDAERNCRVIERRRHTHEAVLIANAQWLSPRLHCCTYSVTKHKAAAQMVSDACDGFRRRIRTLLKRSKLYRSEVEEGRAATRQFDPCVNRKDFAVWKNRIERTLRRFGPFVGKGHLQLKAEVDVEHWRTIEYLISHPELSAIHKRPVRKKSPEIEARDAEIMELWEQNSRSPATAWRKWNSTHFGEDQMDQEAFKKVIVRYRKAHPEIESGDK